jgi:hypothetical protein
MEAACATCPYLFPAPCAAAAGAGSSASRAPSTVRHRFFFLSGGSIASDFVLLLVYCGSFFLGTVPHGRQQEQQLLFYSDSCLQHMRYSSDLFSCCIFFALIIHIILISFYLYLVLPCVHTYIYLFYVYLYHESPHLSVSLYHIF